MASGRQLSNGFYLRRSQFQRGPSAAALSTMFDNLLLDFERRLTTKIFDKNRTLTALSSEVRQTVTVENVPQLVFERCFKQQVSGKEAVIRTVAELLDVFPCHSLVRRHFAGDFCVVLPLLQCSLPISHSSLSGLPQQPLTPNFSAQKGEIFVALGSSPFSDRFLEVFSPFPGDGLNLSEEEYPRMRLSCGQTDFVFPPSSRSTDIDPDSGFGQVELMGVKKDVGAAVKSGELEPGNVVMVRGQQYKVVGVTGGGMPCELYGGADLVVFDKPFPMNAKKVIAYHCPPVIIRAKHGYLPSAALESFHPVVLKYSSSGVSKRLGMGCVDVSFSTLAFNSQLICHRDSFFAINFF